MRGGDVEIEVADGAGEIVQQAGAVEADHLDHAVAARQPVVEAHVRRHRERAVARFRRGFALGDGLAQPQGAAQRLLHRLGDAFGAAQFVGVFWEGARHRDDVEREAVGGGEDLRVDDVGARRRAGAGEQRQEARMVDGQHRDLGDAAIGVGRHLRFERAHLHFREAQESGVLHLAREIDLEPVVGIVPRRIGVEIGIGPVERAPQFVLRGGDARLAVGGRMAARQRRLRLVIERAHQLALPAVPHARPDSADVAQRQAMQQAQTVDRLHPGGESLDGARVGEIAALRRLRHGQMLLDQPGDRLGLALVEPEARAQPPRDLRAGDGVILLAAFGDVVQ